MIRQDFEHLDQLVENSNSDMDEFLEEDCSNINDIYDIYNEVIADILETWQDKRITKVQAVYLISKLDKPRA